MYIQIHILELNNLLLAFFAHDFQQNTDYDMLDVGRSDFEGCLPGILHRGWNQMLLISQASQLTLAKIILKLYFYFPFFCCCLIR